MFALPALLAPLAIFATSSAAHADIVANCAYDTCTVYETMGNGDCSVSISQTNSTEAGDSSGTFARAWLNDYDTGYTCHFWVERDVNNTGWYTVSPVSSLASSSSTYSANYYNGGGYQAQACFQFDWGSSLGAVHCSGAVYDEG
jgi:TRAP-type mannitol/chloroaromatic compound transport system substrate-binding protein